MGGVDGRERDGAFVKRVVVVSARKKGLELEIDHERCNCRWDWADHECLETREGRGIAAVR